MRLFVVSVCILVFVADCVVYGGVIRNAELEGGGSFGGYSMSDDAHSGDDFGAFTGGNGFGNDILESSGEHFGGDYGDGHGNFEYGGFGGGHGSGMSHEDNAALSAVGLANLLSGGGIGGSHAHLASSGGSSYTISGPTQEIQSIHKISTTSTGGRIIGGTKGAAAEAPKYILVKSDGYLGDHTGGAALAAGRGGYSGGRGGYSGGHGGSPGAHPRAAGPHAGLAGVRVDLSHGGFAGHEELSSGQEELSTGHEGHGGHVEFSSGHGGSSAHDDFEMGNSLGYAESYADMKAHPGWRKA